MTGPIPNLNALTNLEYLDLGGNQLTGPIPNLSTLSILVDLSLGGNLLTGPIPNLNGLTNLEYLDLGRNQLTGPIPYLSTLSNLTGLSLYNNQTDRADPQPRMQSSTWSGWTSKTISLTVPIPNLSTLSNLTSLSLDNNQLSGPIPDLSVLSNLEYLSLSYNQLSGPIPDLSALTYLTELYLDNNQMSGPIPDLSTLIWLVELDLSCNQLCLPEDFEADHLHGLNLPTCPNSRSQITPQNPTSPEDRAALVTLYQTTNGANWIRRDNWLSDAPVGTLAYGVVIFASGRITELTLGFNRLIGPIPDLSALTNLEDPVTWRKPVNRPNPQPKRTHQPGVPVPC